MTHFLRAGDPVRDAQGREFRILELLEDGVASTVCLARPQNEPSLRALVKVVHGVQGSLRTADSDSALLDRLARQQNPNLLSVMSVLSTEEGGQLLFTELVPAETLAAYLQRRGRLSLEESLRMALQVGSALCAVSAADAVLPVLSTRTILIRQNGSHGTGEELLQVAPFGVISVPSTYATVVSRPQDQATAGVDKTADQLALASLFVELLTGQALYVVATEAPTSTLAEPLARIATLPVPRRLREVLSRVLQADRQLRFPSIQLFVAALREATAQTVISVVQESAVAASALGGVQPQKLPGLLSYVLVGFATILSGLVAHHFSQTVVVPEPNSSASARVDASIPLPPNWDLATVHPVTQSANAQALATGIPDAMPAVAPLPTPVPTTPTTPEPIPTHAPTSGIAEYPAKSPGQLVTKWKVTPFPSSLPAAVANRWRRSLTKCFTNHGAGAPRSCKLTLSVVWSTRRYLVTHPECRISSLLREALENCANQEASGALGELPPDSLVVEIYQREMR